MKRKLAFLGAILLAAFIFTYEGKTYLTHALDEEDQAWIEKHEGLCRISQKSGKSWHWCICANELSIREEADDNSAKQSPYPADRWWRSWM